MDDIKGLIARLRWTASNDDKPFVAETATLAAEALENLDAQLDVLVKEDIEAQQELAGYRALGTLEHLQGIEDIPAADVVEVVHGKWIKVDNGIRLNQNTGEPIRTYLCDCSCCGWHTGNQGVTFNYCPNCGAKMDGGVTDENSHT